jgi:hypothetical protein
LASVKGHADLTLDGLTFDNALQPDRLSVLAQGTIANAPADRRHGPHRMGRWQGEQSRQDHHAEL